MTSHYFSNGDHSCCVMADKDPQDTKKESVGSKKGYTYTITKSKTITESIIVTIEGEKVDYGPDKTKIPTMDRFRTFIGEGDSMELDMSTQNLECEHPGQTTEEHPYSQPVVPPLPGAEYRNVQPRKTPGSKEDTDTPESNEDTETPESNRGTETPESKKDTETPESKEDMETPESNRGTKTQESYIDAETPETNGDIETPESKEDTETPESNRGTETSNLDTVTLESNEDTETPESNRSTETPESNEDTETLESNEDTETLESNEDTETPESNEDTETPASKEDAEETPESKEATDTVEKLDNTVRAMGKVDREMQKSKEGSTVTSESRKLECLDQTPEGPSVLPYSSKTFNQTYIQAPEGQYSTTVHQPLESAGAIRLEHVGEQMRVTTSNQGSYHRPETSKKTDDKIQAITTIRSDKSLAGNGNKIEGDQKLFAVGSYDQRITDPKLAESKLKKIEEKTADHIESGTQDQRSVSIKTDTAEIEIKDPENMYIRHDSKSGVVEICGKGRPYPPSKD